ncbi:MAG TPA: hypothetical protein EYQ50_00615 [Verrucomicrobiales bacterium]|nr:hypothetical protein [Verrucomicrobiales bacterium]
MFRQALQTIVYFTAASLIASAEDSYEAGELFQKRRSELIAKYDQNSDGRLNSLERETMRSTEKDDRLKPSNRNRNRKPRYTKEFLAKYDKDKDGDMSRKEWEVAWPAEAREITAQYDVNKNGELDDDERKQIKTDVKGGIIKNERIRIAWSVASEGDDDEKGEEEGFITAQKKLLKFDRNGDGIADADELKAVRNSRK